MHDVKHFRVLPEDLSHDALCPMAHGGLDRWGGRISLFLTRSVRAGHSHIQRLVHAMFKAWHSMGEVLECGVFV